MNEEAVRKKAEEHWDYIESILLEEMRMKRKLFIDGFIHGCKHGSDETRKECQPKWMRS